MKISIIFLSLFAVITAIPAPKPTDIQVFSEAALSKNKPINLKLSPEFIKEFITVVQNHQVKGELTAVLNDYADKIFENLDKIFIEGGLDPLPIQEIHEKFQFLLIIASLDMTNGWLQDLSTIHRGGDVLVTYVSKERLTVKVPIAFNTLQLLYDYVAKLELIPVRGMVEGKISGLKVEVQLGFDIVNYQASLDHFYILESGHIDLNFSGNSWTDWILNLVVDVASAALHKIILLIMENIVRNPIQAIVDAVNEILNNILHPTMPPSVEFFNYIR